MKKIFYLLLISLNLVNAQENQFLERGFWKEQPSIKTIDQKIAEGNDPTELNRFGFDAVAWALLENVDNNTIKHLLKIKGNGVNKLTHDGRTYIFWAAYKDNIEIVKYLIDNGAKMDVIDDKGYSIVNFAATTGQQNPKLYDLLVNNGAQLDAVTPKGANALLLVTPSLKNLDFISYFTDKGFKLTDVDNNGNGMFNYAATKDNREILNAIIAKGLPYKQLNNNGGNAMLFATKGSRRGYNSLDYFKYLESLGISPNIKNKNGRTALHNLAYSCKDLEVFNYFIDKGTDVNSTNKDGNTALLSASYRNNIEVIELLLKHTKNINHTNKEGASALTYAIEGNSTKVIDLLLKKGGDLTVVDKKGNNLMYYLLQSYSPKKEKEFTSKIELLGAAGLDLKSSQKNGNTHYHIAVDKNSLELAKYLKPFKININAKNKEGYTALQKAVMSAKNTDLIKYLLHKGADKTVTTDFDESVFDLANENEALKNEDLSFLK
ncbi:ankyrin repeat domain-containing protein [Pseudofulvibacter geojedonensis]|uniref:Ankyrin repeat domain-containing protein n=1 Tax=Pseudofulvibacter geojedonensis TaxID=1123758 RepID=A0ABW3I2J3_9FLAO